MIGLGIGLVPLVGDIGMVSSHIRRIIDCAHVQTAYRLRSKPTVATRASSKISSFAALNPRDRRTKNSSRKRHSPMARSARKLERWTVTTLESRGETRRHVRRRMERRGQRTTGGDQETAQQKQRTRRSTRRERPRRTERQHRRRPRDNSKCLFVQLNCPL